MPSIFPNPLRRYLSHYWTQGAPFLLRKVAMQTSRKLCLSGRFGGNCSGTISQSCWVLCSSGESAERNREPWKCWVLSLVSWTSGDSRKSERLTENELYTSFVFIQWWCVLEALRLSCPCYWAHNTYFSCENARQLCGGLEIRDAAVFLIAIFVLISTPHLVLLIFSCMYFLCKEASWPSLYIFKSVRHLVQC